MLRPLGELVGPHGVLFVEGWLPTAGDWLRPRDFASALLSAQFDARQVILTGISSADEDLLAEDDDFAELIEAGVALVFRESLHSLLSELVDEGVHISTDPRVTDGTTVSIRVAKTFDKQMRELVNHESLCDARISADEYRQLCETMRILEPVELSEPVTGTPSELRRACLDFLERPSEDELPRVKQFAFSRPFLANELQPTVLNALDSPSPQDRTIVVSGQSGSGKTTALCLLAVRMRARGLPVVFVPRGVVPPNQLHIDRLARILLDADSTAPILLIWDGLEPVHSYEKLSRFFASRGRKVLVIGTAHELAIASHRNGRKRSSAPSTDILQLSVELGEDERDALLEHFSGFIPEAVAALREYHHGSSYDNFFATLYYLFDGMRPRLQRGLVEEIERGVETLCLDLMKDLESQAAAQPLGDLQVALMEALGSEFQELLSEANDSRDKAEQIKLEVIDLLNATMVSVWAGLPLPISLGLRLVPTDTMLAYKRTLQSAPFIRELERSGQQVYLDARHPLEADLWCRQRLPNHGSRIDVILKTVSMIRPHEAADDRAAELDYVVKLFRAIGPQGRDKCRVPDRFLSIADAVDMIAQTAGGQIHPRLLLVHANAIREGVRERQQVLGASPDAPHSTVRKEIAEWQTLLRRADESLLQAQSLVQERTSGGHVPMGGRNFLVVAKTERAAVLGSQLRCIIEETRRLGTSSATEPAVNGVFEQARSAWRDSLAWDDENQQTYDVASWILRDRLSIPTMPEVQRIDALAEWMEILEAYRGVVASPDQHDKVDMREREFAISRGDAAQAQAVLQRMIARGSLSAHTLHAREIETHAGNKKARVYLESHCRDSLLSDRHLLLLYHRLWWETETGLHGYFPHDHMLLPFAENQWESLIEISTARLALEGESRNRLALFHRGWALLQQELSRESFETFGNLASVSEGAFRRGRTLAVLSDELGAPRSFYGEVRGSGDARRGRAWVDELRLEIPFNSFEFEDQERASGAPFGPFHIALNYRGAFAQRPERTPKRRG